MKNIFRTFCAAIVAINFSGYQEIRTPEKAQKDEQLAHTVSSTDSDLPFKNGGTSYVPIYSDIYSETKEIRFQLTATLSIRNSSPADTLFISKVSYHNTAGETVREYVIEPIFLKPLETLENGIEQNDNEGGTRANFMINWSANRKIKPLFQGSWWALSANRDLLLRQRELKWEPHQKNEI